MIIQCAAPREPAMRARPVVADCRFEALSTLASCSSWRKVMLTRSPTFSCAVVGLIAALATAQAAAQFSYPDRPIRVIVPLAPGGGSDYTARYIGLRLADRVYQSVGGGKSPAPFRHGR